jgi:hypothetical protein
MEDAQLVRHRYDYDQETGEWLWRNPPARAPKSKASPGVVAGTIDRRDGNRQLNLDGKIHPAGRLAWLYVYGEWPPAQIIYEDSSLPIPARDRLSNLRLAGAQTEMTADLLKQLLDYDADEGVFRWRVSRKGTKIGNVAGGARKTNDGTAHWYIRIDLVDYAASRLAWLYTYGVWPTTRLTFKNGRTADNRIGNLVESGFEHQTRQTPEITPDERRERLARAQRRHDLKRDFGIDEAAYDAMHAAQGGLCAICEKPETAVRDGKVKWLAVDHSHHSDEIRQLLCQRCNVMIGHCNDDIEVLRKAIAYLERHAQSVRAVA